MLLPELTTSRLKLRAWREDDFEPHVRWEADHRVNEFLPFLHAPRTPEASREQIDRFFARSAETRQEWAREWVRKEADKPFHWWAVEATGVADVIGGIGLAGDAMQGADVIPPATGIHWRFAPAYWGKGYATEAASAVLSYGFTTLGLNEIFSMSALGHKKSFALMERIGLRYVKAFLFPLLPEDHPLRPYAFYTLRRTEWEKTHALNR
jgi:RimJ/RimL family protein N-acetyltransferase